MEGGRVGGREAEERMGGKIFEDREGREGRFHRREGGRGEDGREDWRGRYVEGRF